MSLAIWSARVPLPPSDLAYHLRQYERPYRSTEQLADFIRAQSGPLLGVIDAACGAGANLFWLTRWGVVGGGIGLDLDEELIAIAGERNKAALFSRCDVISPWVASHTLSIQTLSFIEEWRPMLAKILEQTRKWVFVTSLFWDGIETHTHVGAKHYNVIDRDALSDFALARGAVSVAWDIPRVDIELERPPRGQMGTYTEAGMEFSGPLLMPWRFAAIRMDQDRL